MAGNDSILIRFSEGRGVNLGKAKPLTKPWAIFRKMFEKPSRTKERRKQFDKMPKDEQDTLKAVDGWIIGAHVTDGKRTNKNVQPRDLLSLDIDYATPQLLIEIEHGLNGFSAYEFFVHSSRRHTDDKPRLRLFAPLSRPATPDEYPALARILAQKLDPEMTQVDKVSFRRAQMMFKPTASSDGDWFFFHNPGEVIDVDAVLAEFGDWQDISKLPRCADEEELRSTAEKAEDPTTKKGPVGDFCRAYDVVAAIEKFLPEYYAPADDFSEKPRYTYLKGTSTSGAVVEDGGLFLYSHHGSDPTSDMLVNAFDLVRIHLFGDKDEDVEKGTSPTKVPSYKAMLEFIREDDGFRRSQAESRYDMAAMFDDVSDEDDDDDEQDDGTAGDSPEDDSFDFSDDPDIADLVGDIPTGGSGSPASSSRPKAKKPGKPPKDWFSELELDQNGRINNTSHNAALIVQYDARLFGAIGFNEFTRQFVLRRPVRSKLAIFPSIECIDTDNGDRWQDWHDHTLRALLEAPNGAGKAGYGMKITDRDRELAIVMAARRNPFHPVKDYFESLDLDAADPTLVDALFTDYLNAPDTEYHRQAARWIMVASVARIFEPGHKFDFAPIIEGLQGIGKSTFVRVLYGDDWFGELDCRLDDRQQIAEAIAGVWGSELPELSGFHKSDHNAAKMFLRRQTDDVRMAYDRRTSEFPRQTVFWGTTNDSKYLKDPTGNRSYWPIKAGIGAGNHIDTPRLRENRDVLWASAYKLYLQMREAQPHGTLPLFLSGEAAAEAHMHQEGARTMELHEAWAEAIENWADTPVLLSQLFAEYGRSDFRFTGSETGIDPETTWVVRCAFRQGDASQHALGKPFNPGDYQHVQNIDKALGILIGRWDGDSAIESIIDDRGKSVVRGRFGVKARWKVRLAASAAERKRGWMIVPAPDEITDEDLFGLDPEIEDLI